MTKMELLLKINGGYERGARAKIAKCLGLTLSGVCKWFLGREKPSMQNIDKMARMFDIPSEEIYEAFYGAPQKNTNYFFENSGNIAEGASTINERQHNNEQLLNAQLETIKKTLENLDLRLKLLEKERK